MKDRVKKEFVIDLSGAHDAAALHTALAAGLPMPAHYGRNLDALFDVLTEYGAGWRIVFRGAGPEMEGLRAVCRGMNVKAMAFQCLYKFLIILTEHRKTPLLLYHTAFLGTIFKA